MTTSIAESENLYFLQGGGEMGRLIREKDWSKTALGTPAAWPQSLRTMVGVVLNNPFGMYIAWGGEYIQLYNDGYRPILGSIKHPAALGISTRETFEEIWSIIGPMFDGVMEGKAVGFPDFMLPLNRNGFVEECYFDFSYSPILIENGQVGGVLVTVIETTAKKRTEDALRQTEERFRTMADNIPNLAWMADAAGWIFWYNQRWYEYTGTTSEQMEGWGWEEVHDPEALLIVLPKWKSSIASGEPFEMVFPLKGADGRFRQFLTRVQPVTDSKGNIYQWFGTNTDITERIEAERALKESEENIRNTVLQAPVAMCILRGPEYIVELANDRMFELWGKTAEVLSGKPIFAGLPEARNQGFEALLHGVYTSGNAFAAEGVPIRLPRHAGIELVYINFVYAAYRNSNGSILGILAVAIDVTQQVLARHQIEQIVEIRTRALSDANRNLQKSNDDLMQFAYVASHDLQEPLRKICIFSGKLKGNSAIQKDEQSGKYLDKIIHSSLRMTSLIKDLLGYSALINAQDGFQTVDLNKVIAEVKIDYELLIQEKLASIQFEGLPSVEGIPLQMTQLFGNLIGNALKYSRPDVPPIIVVTAAVVSGSQLANPILSSEVDYYDICVADNGIGFNKEYADKIFEIFQRLNPTSSYEGTGIGLAICKKIALNHHGDLHARESTEQGAIFHAIIPVRQTREWEEKIFSGFTQ